MADCKLFSVKSCNQIKLNMNLFALLRQHALIQPDTVALSSRHRLATYRKLWSRIERATARLQGEWDVRSGAALAYCGQAHPDAIVLYMALARCGARLVPLEHPALQSQIDAIARELDIKIVLHDDDHAPVGRMHGSAVFKPLSALIMTRCPYQPSAVVEDQARCSLVNIDSVSNGRIRHTGKSLDQIAAHIPALSGPRHEIADSLFDQAVFAPIVLPTLIAGGTLIFR